jgi:hypothetical protein
MMSFGSACKDLKTIGTYQRADDWWHKAPVCRSAKMDPKFQKSLHPRKPSAFPHYRLERGPNADYYDLALYDTALCRLFKPQPNGNYEVWYTHTGSQTDSLFHNRVTPYESRPMTTDGDRAVVPLALTRRHREDFTAKCVYTASGLLIRSESWHVPHGKRFMTKERRDERKEVVRLSEPYVTMAIVGRDNLDIYSDHMCITHSRHKHADDWLRQEPTEEIINGIMRMAYTIKTQWERRNRKWVHNYDLRTPNFGEYVHVPMPDNKLREEMISRIHSISQTGTYKDGWQDMPMFITASEYPRTGLPFKSPRD